MCIALCSLAEFLAEHDEHLRDETCPPGLVAGAASAAGVAVEVFMEEHELAPVRVVVEEHVAAVHCPRAIGLSHKDSREAARKLNGDLLERHHVSRACGTLHLKGVAVVQVVLT